MITRTITGTLYSTTGDPLVGAPVVISADRSIYLTDPDVTYLPGSVKGITDATGEFSVAVEEGLPVLWNVALPNGETISHGLVTTPTKYGATTTTADEYLAITAVSSTTLTVALTKHDGTAGTTANVAWWAEV